ncbi:transcription cofactor vestigial-like protein 4b isoform X1 [Synchiropus splendidus]|uniref:transcription cofactor vestigial-like protein 4b isoform X1 n=1 Tax=Synchiropus splendidus TaxID=270530 RepID=UPI00237E4EE8|nr:transcription cofactor vestigial-like protein 4b isoform X1 [Synchiropus splendidus]
MLRRVLSQARVLTSWPRVSTNQRASLSPPARNRIPSFQTFLPPSSTSSSSTTKFVPAAQPHRGPPQRECVSVPRNFVDTCSARGVKHGGRVQSGGGRKEAAQHGDASGCAVESRVLCSCQRRREKPAGDYRSSRDARLVLPGALGVHQPWHAHHQHLASLEQPLALTKSSRSSSAAPSLPHALGAAERQQNRPSVITCAPASNRNCSLSHCPLSHPASYRRLHAGVSCDPVIEEHFRRSLGKNYRQAEAGATNSVSITGSVDDHFAKALGDAWQQIKNKGSPSSSGSSPNSSPDSHMISHSPSVVS